MHARHLHGPCLAAGASAALAFAASAGERPERDDILGPDDVKAGMKGFGLTVFRGSEPERFTVEVVGRLRNAFPRQDIILIRSHDEKLKNSRVVAGMSGSPIYVECADGKERLIGALAYYMQFRRLYVYAVLLGFGMLGTDFLNGYVGSPLAALIVFSAPGSIILLIGVVLLIRFLRKYPKPTEEAIDDAP